jgi:hypothetical protein
VDEQLVPSSRVTTAEFAMFRLTHTKIAVFAAAAAIALGFMLPAPLVRAQVPGEFDYYDDDIDDFKPCMSDYRVRQKFADMGYTNVKLNQPMGSFYQVKAVKNGAVWLIRYNTCSQKIFRSQRLGAG